MDLLNEFTEDGLWHERVLVDAVAAMSLHVGVLLHIFIHAFVERHLLGSSVVSSGDLDERALDTSHATLIRVVAGSQKDVPPQE